MKHAAPKARRWPLVIIALAGIAIIALLATFLVFQVMGAKPDPASAGTEDTLGMPVEAEMAPVLAENPIDWDALAQENEHIYAWLTIPNTNIDYAVLQHPTEDAFYLEHDRTGAYLFDGSIYSEATNAKDFSDPVTVLYGHNLLNGTMFTQLHKFEDPEFFKENPEFTVYQPGRKLTYTVVSAYRAGNDHILDAHKGFADPDVVRAYFAEMQHPKGDLANVNEDVSLGDDDTILQLSTCTGNHATRWVVTGVLTADEETV